MTLGKFELTKLRLVDTRLAFLAGYGDYRMRAELGRIHVRDGWWVKSSNVRLWKMLPMNVSSGMRTLWEHEWTH